MIIDFCTAGFIPGDPVAFVTQLSERIAEFAPQLTLDFISEVSAAMNGMDKTAIAQRINCLEYVSPWVKNLAHFANATSPLYERSGARLRDCIRTLSDLSVNYPEVCLFVIFFTRDSSDSRQIASTIQKQIWAEVGKLDTSIVDVILDELVRAATDGGIGTRRCEAIALIVASLTSINVRGKLFSKLRKVCFLHLSDNACSYSLLVGVEQGFAENIKLAPRTFKLERNLDSHPSCPRSRFSIKATESKPAVCPGNRTPGHPRRWCRTVTRPEISLWHRYESPSVALHLSHRGCSGL